jgi:hypothetical protein
MADTTVLRSHAVDDFEQLRTGTVRTLRTNIWLLQDGLDALRAGRTHITDEFLERALDALIAEHGRLAGARPTI